MAVRTFAAWRQNEYIGRSVAKALDERIEVTEEFGRHAPLSLLGENERPLPTRALRAYLTNFYHLRGPAHSSPPIVVPPSITIV
jgi:hypothetical protein